MVASFIGTFSVMMALDPRGKRAGLVWAVETPARKAVHITKRAET
jgi:hypothetical protein